jgi:lysozyme family protein
VKANFDVCLEMLLEHEGGYVNHPKDPGGETNLGVTRAVYEQHVGRQVMDGEMRNLTKADVKPIYKTMYWDKVRGDDLPHGLDWSVFDWAVNSGPGRAAKALQRIVGVKPDGGIGPVTLRAVHNFDAADLIEKMHDQRQAFYEGLNTFPTFGRGWTKRNADTLEQARSLLL